MEALSVSDYRNNLAASFDRADEGNEVLIRRKNSLYALVSVGREELTLSPKQQRQVNQIKGGRETSSGGDGIRAIPAKSAMDFINEL